MLKGLLHLHNLLRWAILILLLFNIIKNFANANKPFTNGDKKLGLWLLICSHLTFVVGLVMLIIELVQLPSGSPIMQNDALRFHFIEHPVAMLIAIVLITIGYGSRKKNISDAGKHRRSAILYLIALIIILVTIPWATSSLIPGM